MNIYRDYDGGTVERDHSQEAELPRNWPAIIGLVLTCTVVLSPLGFGLSVVGMYRPRKGLAFLGMLLGGALTVLVVGVASYLISFGRSLEGPFIGRTILGFVAVAVAIDDMGGPPPDYASIDIDPVSDYLKEDMYGEPFHYETDGQGGWRLVCFGPDAQPGGGDDLEFKSGGSWIGFLRDAHRVRPAWREHLKNDSRFYWP